MHYARCARHRLAYLRWRLGSAAWRQRHNITVGEQRNDMRHRPQVNGVEHQRLEQTGSGDISLEENISQPHGARGTGGRSGVESRRKAKTLGSSNRSRGIS